jgi:hypothetical protein
MLLFLYQYKGATQQKKKQNYCGREQKNYN